MSKAREDLPEPETPVKTMRRSRGSSRSMFLRLCCLAPRMRMVFSGLVILVMSYELSVINYRLLAKFVVPWFVAQVSFYQTGLGLIPRLLRRNVFVALL